VAWRDASAVVNGPIFRKITKDGTVVATRMHPDAVRQILKRRADMAGIKGTLREPVSPHGMRAGFVTTAYRNGVPDEEIMGRTRHRSLTTIRGYVRRAKLGFSSPSGKLGL
jgi:integrase